SDRRSMEARRIGRRRRRRWRLRVHALGQAAQHDRWRRRAAERPRHQMNDTRSDGRNTLMVLDRTDVRSTMASYGETTRPTATDFVPCEYVRFYDTEPQEMTTGARTWYARGQNFVLAYTQVESGAEFARTNQLDEYTVLVPDRDGPSFEITVGGDTVNVAPYSIAFVPPGDSRIKVTGTGQVVRLFSVLAEDLVARCSNAASYARPHPNVAPLVPWPDPVGGFKLRVYSLDAPKDP